MKRKIVQVINKIEKLRRNLRSRLNQFDASIVMNSVTLPKTVIWLIRENKVEEIPALCKFLNRQAVKQIMFHA